MAKKKMTEKKEYKKPKVLKVSEEAMVCTAACCSSGYCHGFT